MYNKMIINGLEILGSNSNYYSNLYNFLLDSSNTNNDSELYSNGSYNGSSKINPKTFTLVVNTKKYRDIKSAMHLTYVVSEGEVSFIVDVEEFGEVECLVKKESITTDDTGEMTITLKMCNPYIFSKNYKEIILEKQIEGGWKFPTSAFIIPESWSYTENVKGNEGECINEGFATVYPEILIEGEARKFNILNKTTGEQLNIDASIQTGELLYVDCRPDTRVIKINDVSAIKYKTGQYISLVTGSNELEIDYEGECTVKIRWREAWI